MTLALYRALFPDRVNGYNKHNTHTHTHTHNTSCGLWVRLSWGTNQVYVDSVCLSNYKGRSWQGGIYYKPTVFSPMVDRRHYFLGCRMFILQLMLVGCTITCRRACHVCSGQFGDSILFCRHSRIMCIATPCTSEVLEGLNKR